MPQWCAVIKDQVEIKTAVEAKSEDAARDQILDELTAGRKYDAIAAWAKSNYEVTDKPYASR